MALQRLVIDGFGQVELNNVAFRRDGRVVAQCGPDAEDFATIPVENGMLLAVDEVNHVVKLPEEGSDLPIALVYTSEHIYDTERTPGLKNFRTVLGKTFWPRLGWLAVGDKWTSNTLAYDTEEYTDEEALMAALNAYKTTAVFGCPCANGAVQLTASAPAEGIVLKVIDVYTMPDGQFGVKLQVFKA